MELARSGERANTATSCWPRSNSPSDKRADGMWGAWKIAWLVNARSGAKSEHWIEGSVQSSEDARGT